MTMPPKKYEVVIQRIDPKRHYGLRYAITVYYNRNERQGDISNSHTLRGARREAKKMIAKHELPEENPETVEEYFL